MKPRLSIAIVNYNSGHRLRKCLDHLEANAPSAPWEAVVVDNRSTDGSVDRLRQASRPHVRLIESPANLLWTGGVNLAFRETCGDYFLIMNADVAPLPGSLDKIIRRFDADPTTGAIGGSLVTPAGVPQRYFSQFVTPWQLVRLSYFHPNPSGTSRLRRWYAMADVPFTGPIETPRPAGGCLAVRRALFQGLPLDRGFGIYWSDYDLARKIWGSGRRIIVDPDINFLHDDQADFTPGSEPRLRDLDYLVGAVRYYRLHHGRWRAAQARMLLATGLALAIAIKHFPAMIVGRQSWATLCRRIEVLRLFLRDRNILLEQAQVDAIAGGFIDRHPIL